MAKPKIESALATAQVFEGLSKRHLRQLVKVGTVSNRASGVAIVMQGQPGGAFFVILTGQAKVEVNGRTVNRALPGDFFGEISLLDGGPRSASVIAETPVTLFTLSRRAFVKAIEQEPSISIGIMRSMARSIRRADRSLAH